jgi:hypothetical protein
MEKRDEVGIEEIKITVEEALGGISHGAIEAVDGECRVSRVIDRPDLER